MQLLKISLLILMLVSTVVGAQIHQWKDAQGNIHFGDEPPANVQTRVIDIEVNTYTNPNVESLSAVFDVSADPAAVIMYSAVWCGVCRKAKAYFQANDIAFTEYDVETSRKGKRDYARLKATGVPVILVGGKRLNGFSAGSFERLYRS